jgi:acyl carrier protein
MPALTEDQVLDRIRDELAAIKVPDAESATMDSTWGDLDVDSLDLVELTQVVEETYGVDLEGSDFKTVETVGDVIDLVVARVQE